MVFSESDAGILGETLRVRVEGFEKTLNLPADLRVLGPPPLALANFTSLGLHFHNTPPCNTQPTSPETPQHVVAGDTRGF